ncbi:efflux RND transporter periplasmic adaptor subunit [Alsobacter sp. R-9]
MILRSHRLVLLGAAALLLPILSGCGKDDGADARAGRPVPVVTVATSTVRDAILVTGDIQATKDVDAGFRVGGRVIERTVNVGDRVAAGQLLARLDPTTEETALKAAQATLAAARADITTTRNAYERQQSLIDQGFTTRPRYDQAKQAWETAQARLQDAEARVEAAADRVRFTQLRADAAGVVTARGAEVGEVVQPGRMIVRIARDDGRDAVFDAPASVLRAGSGDTVIRVALVSDPAVVTTGRVREVAPQADPVTRTFRVRVGLDSPPEAMRLGAPVNGSFDLASAVVVSIPASALTSTGRTPAVWVVDPKTSTVSLRPIDVLRFETGRVVVSNGIDPGDVIVAAGVQALHPGQRVKPLAPTRTASPAAGSQNTAGRAAGEPRG